jgi:transposase-like protein
MKRRQWTSEEKTKIVIEGLGGKPIALICTENEISQAQYYLWREHFLKNASKAFDGPDRGVEKLQRQNQRLKGMVADLTLELKKSDEVCVW